MVKNSLSVVILTQNSASFLVPAIASAQFSDEVLIVDSGSTDDTCALAKKLGARVCHQDWLGFGPQKNKAIALASHDWVFVLDSDERIPEALRIEIQTVLTQPDCDGYFVPRLNRFWGKFMKTCGLYPDYSIRLFRKSRGQFNAVPVHEAVQLQGQAGYLKNHMIHLAYDSVESFRVKQRRYAQLSLKEPSRIKALLSPAWTFFRLFVLKCGFLDGWDGFLIAKLYAQYTFWKYKK